MLRDGNPNPLGVFNQRQIEGACPPHFTQVTFDLYLHQTHKEFSDWIWENLEGRFWLGDVYVTGTDHTMENGTPPNTIVKNWSAEVHMYACGAFEMPGEATMFAMCRDQISKPNRLW